MNRNHNNKDKIVKANDNNAVSFTEIYNETEWSQYTEDIRINNLYNSWSWGEYKGRIGWKVHRFIIMDSAENKIIGAFQIQKKRLIIINIFLIQGGVLLPNHSEDKCLQIYQILHNKFVKTGFLNVMLVNYYESINDIYTRTLLRLGYHPLHNNKMYSFKVTLKPSIDIIKERLTYNWRRNLNRALKNSKLKLYWGNSLQDREQILLEFQDMYGALLRRKKFSGAVDIKNVQDIIIRDESFYIVSAKEGDRNIATRIAYKTNTCMIDFLAASSDSAKNNYSNYLLVWAFITISKELGLEYFECGGIDPFDNLGVYNFKRGLEPELYLKGPYWCYSEYVKLNKFIGTLMSWFV